MKNREKILTSLFAQFISVKWTSFCLTYIPTVQAACLVNPWCRDFFHFVQKYYHQLIYFFSSSYFVVKIEQKVSK
ncbi:hypothetical protein E2986_13212 [Frieseomelitta varia]|uniref:Uncharacterized protein n=1 Tax=Frieseomelitta varia TaxID=561572 RepID=A0A833VUR8_9HYME|nr:hypothetical protein E2986_13212 [Frieseomelitta varia]